MKYNIYLLFFILSSFSLFSQNDPYELDFECDCPHTDESYIENVSLNYMSFHDQIPMVYDDRSEIITPHYIDRFNRYPVAYASGKRPVVSALLSAPSCSHPFWIKAETRNQGNDNFSFPERYVVPSSAGDYFYPVTESTDEFPSDKVNAFVEKGGFKVDWFVSSGEINPNTGDRMWQFIGQSSNALFVTHHSPITHIEAHENHQINPTELFLSTIGNSCKAAKGLTDEEDIVDAIYTLFQSKWMSQIGNTGGESGHILSYWTDLQLAEDCFSTFDLYASGVGQSFNFAELMTDMIRVQGLHHSAIKRITYKSMEPSNLFDNLHDDLLRDFFNTSSVPTSYTDLLGPGGSHQPGYVPFDISGIDNAVDLGLAALDFITGDLISPDLSLAELLDDGDMIDEGPFLYVKNYSDLSERSFHLAPESSSSSFDVVWDGAPTLTRLTDDTGIPAQGTYANAFGNIDPPSRFTELFIVENEGNIYDPSYGTPIVSRIADWETNTLDGYGLGIIDLELTVNFTYPLVTQTEYLHWINEVENNNLINVTVE